MFKRILLCLFGTLVLSNINILNAEKNDNQEIPVLIENNGNIGLNNDNNHEIIPNVWDISKEELLERFNSSTNVLMEYVKSSEFLGRLQQIVSENLKLINEYNNEIIEKSNKIKDEQESDKYYQENYLPIDEYNVYDTEYWNKDTQLIIDYDAMNQKIAEHRNDIDHCAVPDTGIWNEIPLIFKSNVPKILQKRIISTLLLSNIGAETLRKNDILTSIRDSNLVFECILPREFVIVPDNSVTQEEELCLLILSIKIDLLTNNTPQTNIKLLAKYLLKLYRNSHNNIQQEINRYRRYFTCGENETLNNLLRNYYMEYDDNDYHNLANYF